MPRTAQQGFKDWRNRNRWPVKGIRLHPEAVRLLETMAFVTGKTEFEIVRVALWAYRQHELEASQREQVDLGVQTGLTSFKSQITGKNVNHSTVNPKLNNKRDKA